MAAGQSVVRVSALIVALGAAAGSVRAQQPIAGPNVNMIRGTTLPNGDPSMQRQNEPSIALSTRNPCHLLAGANDYRIVRDPDPNAIPEGGMAADAWLAVMKSFDCGVTWQSTLLHGYPDDPRPEGQEGSPLRGYEAGADPTVRAGTNGLFYYSGIVFDRAENGKSRLFMARFVDNNDKETGDTIQQLGISVVADGKSGQFVDKPWIAVDIPRAGFGPQAAYWTSSEDGLQVNEVVATASNKSGAGSYCNINGQVIPAGNVYITWARFEGSTAVNPSKIMFGRSTDCGATWDVRPVSNNQQSSQGATLAIAPDDGTVYLAWREFGRSGRAASLHMMRSRDGGMSWDKPKAIVRAFDAFDHPKTTYTFRSNALPSMAAAPGGLVYIATSARGYGNNLDGTANDDARIVLVMSTNGGESFSAPFAIDNNPRVQVPATNPTSPPRGHQFMPALAYAAGRLQLVFYDSRDDISPVRGSYISDDPAIPGNTLRHTIDVRGGWAAVDTAHPVPEFRTLTKTPQGVSELTTQKVTNYLQSATRGTVQFNYPNLTMYQGGQLPFIGDYIDVQGLTAIPIRGVNDTQEWRPNIGTVDFSGVSALNGQALPPLPVFHGAWGDNRDVKWLARNPNSPFASIGNQFVIPAVCEALNPELIGIRNANIYTTRITPGLFVGSTGNTKPLGLVVNRRTGQEELIQRGFTVFVQNTTTAQTRYRLEIVNQPPGGRASFRQFDEDPRTHADRGPRTTLDAEIAARSSIARTVYAKAPDRFAQILVNIYELQAETVTGSDGRPVVVYSPKADGARSSVLLNPDKTNPAIKDPEVILDPNDPTVIPQIGFEETHDPKISKSFVFDLEGALTTRRKLTVPEQLADPTSPDLESSNPKTPDLESPDLESPDLESPDLESPDLESPDLESGSFGDEPISRIRDIHWTIKNRGNTTTSYKFRPAVTGDRRGLKFQMIVTRRYLAPAINPDLCSLVFKTVSQVVVNVPNFEPRDPDLESPDLESPDLESPDLESPDLESPDLESASVQNVTFALAPGEEATLTLRVFQVGGSTSSGQAAGVQPADDAPARADNLVTAGDNLENLTSEAPSATASTSSSFVSTLQFEGCTSIMGTTSDGRPCGTRTHTAAVVISQATNCVGGECEATPPSAAAGPDLVVSDTPTLSSVGVAPGGTIVLDANILNRGTDSTTQSTFHNRFFLSTDPELTFDDDGITDVELLPAAPFNGIIAAGQTAAIPTQALTIPRTTLPGNYYIIVYANSQVPLLTEATRTNNTASVPVTVGFALAFAQQPTQTTQGFTITPPVVIAVRDGAGALVPAGDVPFVTVALSGAGGALSGTLTRPNIGGVATFDDLHVDVPGNYTLVASAPGSSDATSALFNVSADAPPVAVADSYDTPEDQPLTTATGDDLLPPGVLENDLDEITDGPGAPPADRQLTAVVVTPPLHGVLTLQPDGNFTYTPAADYQGPDSFTYRLNDGVQNGNTTTVSIAVTMENDAPIAVGQSVTTDEDAGVEVTLTGSDSETPAAALTFTVVSPPSHGTLSGQPPNLSYTPALNYAGPDSFTFRVTDAGNPTGCGPVLPSCAPPLTSAPATVDITVIAINDAPLANNQVLGVPFGSATSVTLTATDADSATLTFVVVDPPTHGELSGLAPNLTYTPEPGYSGGDSFTFRVFDGAFESNLATVSIVIAPDTAENQPPVAGDDAAETDEDTAVVVDVLANDDDPNDDALAVTSVGTPAHGQVVLNVNNTITYTPAGNYNGEDSFTYTIGDGRGGTDTAIVTVTIQPVNDAPVAVDDSSVTGVEMPRSIDVVANDTDAESSAAGSLVGYERFTPAGTGFNVLFVSEAARVASTGYFYVSGSRGIVVVNPGTGGIVDTIDLTPLSGSFGAANLHVVNDATSIVYFRHAPNGISAIDGRSTSATFNELIGTLQLGSNVQGFALDQARGLLYVASVSSAPQAAPEWRLSIVDVNPSNTATFHQVVASVILPANPRGLVVDSASDRVFIAADGVLIRVDNASMPARAVSTVSLSGVWYDLVLNSSNGNVYGFGSAGRVMAYSPTTGTSSSFQVPGLSTNFVVGKRIVLHEATGRVFVRSGGANGGASKITVLDGNMAAWPTSAIVTEIALGREGSSDLIIDQAAGLVVTSLSAEYRVSVIDATANPPVLVGGEQSMQVGSDLELDPVTGRVYAPTLTSLQRLALNPRAVLAPLHLGGEGGAPLVLPGPASTPNTHRFYVGATGSGAAVRGLTVDGTDSALPLPSTFGRYIYGAVNNVTNRLYLLNTDADSTATSAFPSSVRVVDGATNSLITSVDVANGAFAIGINEVTNKIYVGGTFGTTVLPAPALSVIDGATNVVTPIDVSAFGQIGGFQRYVEPLCVGALCSTVNKVYAMLSQSGVNTVAVVNAATNVATPLPGAVGATSVNLIRTSNSLNRVFIGNRNATSFANEVIVLRGDTDEKVTTLVDVGEPSAFLGTQSYVAVDESRGRVYVLDHDRGQLNVLDGLAQAGCSAATTAPAPTCFPLIASVATGFGPTAVAISEAANRVYVTNSFDRTLTIIDGATFRIAGTLALPLAPALMALDTSEAAVTRVLIGGALGEPGAMLVLDDHSGGGLSVAAGSLTQPANGTAALNADGTVVYTPAAGFSGTDSFTYRVSDGTTVSTASGSVTINVIQDLTIATAAMAPGTVGQPYSQQFSALGGVAPYYWSFLGTLPGGLTPNSQTGLLSGTPTQSGTYNIAVQVRDSFTQDRERSFMLVIGPLQVATTSLPTATLDQNYSFALQAGGSSATPFTWTLAPGSNPLPPGITLGADGVLSGMPNQSTCTSASFTVQVTDALSQTATRALTMFFTAPIRITTTRFDGVVLENFNRTVSTSCGSGTRTWSISGTLPRGVAFDTATGQFSSPVVPANSFINNGPKENGVFPVTVGVTDSSGSDSEVVTLNIHAIDQQTSSGTASALVFGGATRLAQTIAVGATGTLTAVRFSGLTCSAPASANPLTVRVVGVSAITGVPDESQEFSTATAIVTATNQIIPFASSTFFTADTRLAIVLSSTGTCQVANPATADNYRMGEAYLDTGSGWAPPSGTGAIADVRLDTLIQNTDLLSFNQQRARVRAVSVNDGRVLFVGINAADVFDPQAGTTATVPMTASRQDATVTQLADGRVLVTGGSVFSGSTTTYLSSAEIFDPATNAFTATSGAMAQGRANHAAALLTCPAALPSCAWGGKVLITGGQGVVGTATFATTLSSAELFDPSTGTFSTVGPMGTTRYHHRATLLADGRVLVTGGFNFGTLSAEVFDASTNTFTPTAGMLEPRARHSATLLADGTVLIAGGQASSTAVATLSPAGEIYTPAPNPANATFTSAGGMLMPRFLHVAVALPDGSVLLSGGMRRSDFVGPAWAATERYVPGTGFTGGPAMLVTRYDHGAVALSDGRLAIGGGNGGSFATRQASQSFEFVNVGAATSTPRIANPILPDGQVNQPYAATLVGTGGTPGYTFALVGTTALPAGITLSGATFSGTPQAVGTYYVGVQITDSSEPDARVGHQTLRIRINALDITTATLPTAYVGQPYSGAILATGIAPVIFTATGTLPPGLTLEANGTFSGVPTTTGFYTFFVRAVDAVGQIATATLSITVNSPLTITTTSLSDGIVTNTYGGCIGRTGGSGQLTWTLSGSVPRGLAFSNNGLSNCFDTTYPARQLLETGTFTFTVTVTDSSVPPQADSETYTIRVHAMEQTVYGTVDPGTVSLPAGRTVAQVLTAGSSFALTGVQLWSINQCTPATTITASVHRVSDIPPRPSSASMATASVVTSASGGFNSFLRFPNSVPVPQHGEFAIAVTFANGSCEGYNWPVNDYYPLGQGWVSDNGGAWTRLADTVGRSDVPMTTLVIPTGMAYTGLWTAGRASAPLDYDRVLLYDGTVRVYDPITHAFTAGPVGNANSVYGATATRLADGRVVIIGGQSWIDTTTVALTGVYIYDPDDGTLTSSGALQVGRANHTATLLPDGRILVAGGYQYTNNILDHLDTAEIYNPTSQTSTSLMLMLRARARHTATLLPNNRVLLAGGYWDGLQGPLAEIFDATGGSFSAPTVDMAGFRAEHTATVFGDGRVLIASGTGNYPDLRADSEIFDPATSAFSAGPSLAASRFRHTATALPDGRVVIAGGRDSWDWSTSDGFSSVEIYNPETPGIGWFSVAPNLKVTRDDHTAHLLQNGDVLMIGSGSRSALATVSAERYPYPAGAPLVITTLSLPDGTVGVSYPLTQVTVAGGSGNYGPVLLLWGQMPSGMQLTSGGEISGTPTVSGPHVFTLRVVDSLQNIAERTLTIRVNGITVTSPSTLPNGAIGQPYSYQFTGTGVGGLTWSAETTPPPNLTLSAGGLLSGTVQSSGWYHFTIRVRDAIGQTALHWVNLYIEPTLLVTTTSLDIAVAPWWYGGCLSASGGGGPQTWTITGGSLPPGVTMNQFGCFDGQVVGTGTYSFFVRVSTAAQQSAPALLEIRAGFADQAAWSVDQSATPSTIAFGNDGVRVAQVFTPSANGALVAVQMPVSCTADLRLEIQGVTGGAPNGTVLQAAVIPASRLGAFAPNLPYHRQLALGFPLFSTPGVPVAAVLASSGPCVIYQMPAISVDADFSYPFGEAFIANPDWVELSVADATRPDLPFHAIVDDGRQLTFMLEGRIQNRDAVIRLDHGPDAGLVLLAGGYSISSQLYNPSAVTINGVPPGRFVTSPSMATFRVLHTLTEMSDGYVVAIGGNDVTGAGLASIELYNPATRTWSNAGSMLGPRAGHTATLLAGDRILVAGGSGTSSAILLATTEVVSYNAATHTVSVVAGPTMVTPRAEHRAVGLFDGRVLITGGWGVPDAWGAELYNPISNTIDDVVPMQTARARHAAALIGDASVLVVGGLDNEGPGGANSVERFDPATGVFTTVAALPSTRQGHQAVFLGGTTMMLAGGSDDAATALDTIDIFDTSTGVLVPAAGMAVARDGLAAVPLSGGRVLLANGWGPSAATWTSAEVFDFNADVLVTGQVGTPYNDALSGGFGFSVASGALPPGLVLAGSGEISGTPTTPGTYRALIWVTDTMGYSLRRIAIRILPPG